MTYDNIFIWDIICEVLPIIVFFIITIIIFATFIIKSYLFSRKEAYLKSIGYKKRLCYESGKDEYYKCMYCDGHPIYQHILTYEFVKYTHYKELINDSTII